MMPSTYTPINSTFLTSDTATITFSSIPATYTDLVCVMSIKGTTATNDIDVACRYNSDTGTNYSDARMYGSGTTTGSQDYDDLGFLRLGNMSGTGYNFTNLIFQINNYSNTTTFKPSLSRSDNVDRIIDAYTQLWRSTSAISTITIFASANFATGSSFSLYGIKAA